MDATVSSSISGNPVTEWTDQSGNQFHATPIEGTVRYPSAYVSASGLIGIDFSGETSQMKIMDPAESKRLLDFSNRTGGFSIMMAYTDRPNRDSLSDASNLIANCDSSKKGFFIRLQDKTNELKFSLAKKELIGVIADGDTLVVGLNYDADTGLYTAKMTTSSGAESTITGTIRPKDFSNNNDLFLGNTSHTQRKLEGMIGKVLIYEDELSEADFLDKMQLLAQIWINPKAKTLGLLLF